MEPFRGVKNNMCNKKTDTGTYFTIPLFFIPAIAMVMGFVLKKYLIPPIDQLHFGVFILKTSSLTCFLLFILSFWKTRKNSEMVIMFIFMQIYWFFGCLFILPIVNVKYDTSQSMEFKQKVIEVHRGSRRSSYVRVEPWGNHNNTFSIPSYMYNDIKEFKSAIRFTTRSGFLGYEYVTSMEVASY